MSSNVDLWKAIGVILLVITFLVAPNREDVVQEFVIPNEPTPELQQVTDYAKVPPHESEAGARAADGDTAERIPVARAQSSSQVTSRALSSSQERENSLRRTGGVQTEDTFTSEALTGQWAGAPSTCIHVRMAAFLDDKLSGVLLPSMWMFWPRDFNQAKLVVVLDEESSEDHRYGERLKRLRPWVPVVRYERPPPRFDEYPAKMRSKGYDRQQWSTFYADLFCGEFELIAYQDSDAPFITTVTRASLFDKEKPIIIGIWGDKTYATSTKWLLQRDSIGNFMTVFPFLMWRKHFRQLREYVARQHGKSFDEIFVRWIKLADKYSQFCVLGNYLWHFHRDEYSWHLRDGPHPHNTPAVRVSWHDKNSDNCIRYLAEGLCHNLPNAAAVFPECGLYENRFYGKLLTLGRMNPLWETHSAPLASTFERYWRSANESGHTIPPIPKARFWELYKWWKDIVRVQDQQPLELCPAGVFKSPLYCCGRGAIHENNQGSCSFPHRNRKCSNCNTTHSLFTYM